MSDDALDIGTLRPLSNAIALAGAIQIDVEIILRTCLRCSPDGVGRNLRRTERRIPPHQLLRADGRWDAIWRSLSGHCPWLYGAGLYGAEK